MNYLGTYNALIVKAKLRYNITGYTEIHHIIPKSFGGGNSDDNLVKLTGREHFIAHRLLAKIYPNSGMAHAVFRMACANNGKYGVINSRTYEYLRKQHAIQVSTDTEANKKKGDFWRGKKQSEAHKQKRTEARKNNGNPWTSQETSRKMSSALVGRKYGPRKITDALIDGHAKGVETRKQNGSYIRSKESIEQGATKQRGVPKNTVFSEERLKALSEEKSKKTVCPHCGKEGAVMVMKRWHFNKCKKPPPCNQEDE